MCTPERKNAIITHFFEDMKIVFNQLIKKTDFTFLHVETLGLECIFQTDFSTAHKSAFEKKLDLIII